MMTQTEVDHVMRLESELRHANQKVAILRIAMTNVQGECSSVAPSSSKITMLAVSALARADRVGTKHDR